jgi:hypothetical protein
VCPLANKRSEGKELSITSASFGTVPVALSCCAFHCNLVRRGILRGTACCSVLYPFWPYKVPQSTFDVKPKHPVTSNHDQLAPIRRTFSGVFACVATGDQPARAGPRVNRHPQQTQPRPLTAPFVKSAQMFALIRRYVFKGHWTLLPMVPQDVNGTRPMTLSYQKPCPMFVDDYTKP